MRRYHVRPICAILFCYVVAPMALANAPNGWTDPQIVTITGQGAPYDGTYTLPWDDGQESFASNTTPLDYGNINPTGTTGELNLNWPGGAQLIAATNDAGRTYTDINGTGFPGGWTGQVAGIPEPGTLAASATSFFLCWATRQPKC